MKELICIVCPKGCHLKVDEEHGWAVSGNSCEKGAEYGKIELTNPTRVITSTVEVAGGAHPRCPVKTDRPIPKGLIFEAMKTLDGGRIGIASQALGLAEGAIEETIKYTKERVQFGRRISQFQNTQFQLADMYAKTEAAKWLVYSAAMKKENHEPYTVDAAMAKLVAAETASDVTRRCVQLFGGYGYTREYPVERMMRDAKICEIYEGTSEVQRMVISANIGVK